MTDVPVVDLRAGLAEIAAEIDEATARVHALGSYVLGDEVAAFEDEFAAFCGTSHAVGVGSGLDALQLILRAEGIGPGDEVVVPAYTAVATWMAVSLVGARPVGADVERETWNIDPAAAEAAMTERTRALLPVHLFGRPADMAALERIAERHGVLLLEDAAQAHGARAGDRRAGALARAAAFSFYPVKNLGAFGDGGAITTSDDELADRLRLLRTYGWRTRGESEIKGLNSRLDEIQAAWLRVKLRRLDAWNERRREVVRRYLDALRDVDGLTLPAGDAVDESAWHQFVVASGDRDALAARLRESGVGTLVHYDPLPHLTGAYRADGWGEGAFPVAEDLARRALSLPLFPHLSAGQVQRVVDAVAAR
jgi:dTDP-3-amino-3,4,6-trideoxy-alpha-D-glucose transaminase